MKKYPHIFQKIYHEPWLITAEKHASIRHIFEQHAFGEKSGLFDNGKTDAVDESKPRMSGDTLILPVHGILGKHLDSLEMISGGCCVDDIGVELGKAESNYRVANVLLDFRSPGGVVTGIPELASKIADFPKDIVAFTDIECCSGAIWLASQCDKFYSTESAMVGSVGVYSIYLDKSEFIADLGVKVNAISAGVYKLAGASFKPMTEDERAMFQSRCDGIYEKFKAAMTMNRSIPDEYLQGQVFYGDEACDCAMVDGLVSDMAEVLDLLM